MAVTEAGQAASRAVDDLYRQHGGEVYRYAYAVLGNHPDAEDVTQTTFLNAYRALEQGARPRKPANWLLTIASNAIKQRFRRERSRPREVEFDERLAGSEPDEESPSIGELLTALSRIPPKQRQAIVLREFEGRAYSEIAEILCVTTSALETLLFRARRSLAEELEQQLTCTEAQFAVSKAVDGRLGRKERRRLRNHLTECPDCAHFARLQPRHRSALRGLMLIPIPLSLSIVKGLGGPGTATAAPFPVAIGDGTGTAATGSGFGATSGGAAGGSVVAGGATIKAAALVAAAAVAGGVALTGALELRNSLDAKPSATSTQRDSRALVTPRGVAGGHAGEQAAGAPRVHEAVSAPTRPLARIQGAEVDLHEVVHVSRPQLSDGNGTPGMEDPAPTQPVPQQPEGSDPPQNQPQVSQPLGSASQPPQQGEPQPQKSTPKTQVASKKPTKAKKPKKHPKQTHGSKKPKHDENPRSNQKPKSEQTPRQESKPEQPPKPEPGSKSENSPTGIATRSSTPPKS